ncbi:hypothetical protein KCU90_g23, partial [Aureobasidium melanogenum]
MHQASDFTTLRSALLISASGSNPWKRMANCHRLCPTQVQPAVCVFLTHSCRWEHICKLGGVEFSSGIRFESLFCSRSFADFDDRDGALFVIIKQLLVVKVLPERVLRSLIYGGWSGFGITTPEWTELTSE